MSNVDFGEINKINKYNLQDNFEGKGLTGLLIKWGIAKNSKTAEFIMLGSAILFFGISIYISINFLFPINQTKNKQEIINPLQNRIDNNIYNQN